DKRKVQKRYYAPWCEKLRGWAGDAPMQLLNLPDAAWKRLCHDGLAEAWKSGDVPAHPALDALATLQADLHALPNPRQAALRHAAAWIRQRFEQEKRRRAEMGFDDMLVGLDVALHGANGERLADVIR